MSPPPKNEKREDITFAEITPEWVQGFKDYLENEACAWTHDLKDKPLARNSKVSYFNKLRACLNQAFEERIIAVNPLRGIEGFKAEEGTRMYLTIEEVKKLAQPPAIIHKLRPHSCSHVSRDCAGVASCG